MWLATKHSPQVFGSGRVPHHVLPVWGARSIFSNSHTVLWEEEIGLIIQQIILPFVPPTPFSFLPSKRMETKEEFQ